MKKLKKLLKKLHPKDRKLAQFIINRLVARDFFGLNIVKLKSQKDLFRVKAGRLRIVYNLTDDTIIIKQVGLRSEKTYTKF